VKNLSLDGKLATIERDTGGEEQVHIKDLSLSTRPKPATAAVTGSFKVVMDDKGRQQPAGKSGAAGGAACARSAGYRRRERSSGPLPCRRHSHCARTRLRSDRRIHALDAAERAADFLGSGRRGSRPSRTSSRQAGSSPGLRNRHSQARRRDGRQIRGRQICRAGSEPRSSIGPPKAILFATGKISRPCDRQQNSPLH
jgi:hypothetical protein